METPEESVSKSSDEGCRAYWCICAVALFCFPTFAPYLLGRLYRMDPRGRVHGG